MEESAKQPPPNLINLPPHGNNKGVWTPECVDEPDLLGLAEEGSHYLGSDRLLSHMVECLYCRNSYIHLLKSLKAAHRAREIQEIQARILAETSSMSGLMPPVSTVLLDWTGLSASSGQADNDIVGIFCEGALRVTVWLDGEQAILTAENDPLTMWNLDEHKQPFQIPGAGILLAGRLIRYDISTPQGDLTGYLVLPSSEGVSVAEVDLGAYRRLAPSTLSCRVASPSELTDSIVVSHSVLRAHRQLSRAAWESFVLQNAEKLMPVAREAIQKALNST
jgi:hypothetical protein